jgi:hypothetical protein
VLLEEEIQIVALAIFKHCTKSNFFWRKKIGKCFGRDFRDKKKELTS